MPILQKKHTLQFDHNQPRLLRPRLSVFGYSSYESNNQRRAIGYLGYGRAGTYNYSWLPQFGSEPAVKGGFFIEPFRSWLTVLPTFLHKDYYSELPSVANYKRYVRNGIYQYTANALITVAGDEKFTDEKTVSSVPDGWLHGQGLNPIAIRGDGFVTKTALSRNQGFSCSYFVYDSGEETRSIENEVLYRIAYANSTTWSNDGNCDEDVLWFQIFTNGRIQVFNKTNLLGEGNIGATQPEASSQAAPGTKTPSFVSFYVTCSPTNELIIYGSDGNAFAVPMPLKENPEEDGTYKYEVPSSYLRFHSMGLNDEVKISLGPLTYVLPANACALSRVLSFPDKVTAEYTSLHTPVLIQYNIHDDNDVWSLVSLTSAQNGKFWVQILNEDGTAGYNPIDGLKCRLFIKSLTSLTITDGTTLPMIAGLQMGYRGAATTTPDYGTDDLFAYTKQVVLEVPDGNDPTSLTLQLYGRVSELSDGRRSVSNSINRPCRITTETSRPIFDGRATADTYEYVMTNVDASVISLSCKDYLGALEAQMVHDLHVWDGWKFVDMIERLLGMMGVPPSDILFEPSRETIFAKVDIHKEAGKGQYYFASPAGTSVKAILDELFDRLAPTWYYGFRFYKGKYQFCVIAPDQIDFDTPVCTIYDSVAIPLAEDEAGTRRNSRTSTFRERPTYTTLPPEATYIRLTGQNPSTNQIVQMFYVDRTAENPSLSPWEQPANWVGERYSYVYADPLFKSTNDLKKAMKILIPRLTRPRILIEWRCDMIYHQDGETPVWRGDVVELIGIGKVQVKSLRISFEREPDDLDTPGKNWESRPATYVGELVDSDNKYGLLYGRTNQVTLSDIVASRYALSGTKVRSYSSKNILGLPAEESIEYTED